MKVAERFWGELAGQIRSPHGWFGRCLGHVMAWEHRHLLRWAMSFADIGEADAVLDVGCGGGMGIKMMATRARAGFVAGIDHSSDMVRQACWRNATLVRSGRGEVRQGDVARLPYEDDTFDRALAVESFFFWPDPRLGLEEIHRVLKPGGRVLIVTDASKEGNDREKLEIGAELMGTPLYSGSDVVELLEASGFREARFESVPDRGRGWLCAVGVKEVRKLVSTP